MLATFLIVGWNLPADHLPHGTSKLCSYRCFHFYVICNDIINLWPRVSHHWGFHFLQLWAHPVNSVLDALTFQERASCAWSCVFVTDDCARFTKGWLVYMGGIAQLQLWIVKWLHQRQFRACWTVIKRHHGIKRDRNFIKIVDPRDFTDR